jgi:hypothetical protein
MPKGERVRCSADTEDKKQAQELRDKLNVESWWIAKLGEKPRHIWDEATYERLMETPHKKTHKQGVGPSSISEVSTSTS